jgi:methylated-DNA-protein-cysteine methyltransferase related protein
MKKNDENFFGKVYQVTKTIPFGRVTSYGAIARCIGAAGAARMVGWALNNCHTHEEFIPAHRVVNRNGLLTGKHHFRNPDLMQQMLEAEGIEIYNDQVVNFTALFWDPCKELI